MSSFYFLPRGLVILLLALPVFSNESSTNSTTSPSDPFRQLRLHANNKPSEPICCLTPLSTEPLPTAEFLSFEEWKSKQLELQAQAQSANQTPSPDIQSQDPIAGVSTASSSTPVGDLEVALTALPDSVPSFPPHFRVPLTDRFNYASLDCSARVHTSHGSARSPSAILSSKKDRYMLSPCSADPNFVVVELCDDIRIDTVQLANFEFFSGVFREFKVSVAQTYTSDGQGWIEAGTYKAKNIRGIQSFHPLVELRPFYRYIRIDFLSHYGSEFYCPISLLRVYGLTQMEEWKWEVWQSGPEKNTLQAPPEVEGAVASHIIVTESVNGTVTMETDTDKNRITSREISLEVVQPRVSPTTSPRPHDSHIISSDLHTAISPLLAQPTILEPSLTSFTSSQATVVPETVSEAPVSTTSASSSTAAIGGEALRNISTAFDNTSPVHADGNDSSTPTNASHPTSLPPSSSIPTLVPLPSSSPSMSGESIYRTIMKRLAMLETNTTLYQRYVEEQTLQIRDALGRLEEDVGRLKGITKVQQQVFSKTMQDLELRRRQMDKERWELLIKINHLADEVTLEKRLGIAQLCLLITVLIFMALTRGSRVALLDGTMHSFNSFSHRRIGSSTDLSRKRWLSRSRTPTPMDYSVANKESNEAREVIISSSTQEHLTSSVPFPTTPPAASQNTRSVVRRPTTPRRQDILRVLSESRPSGRLRRSNSHTTPGSAVLSAKRLARTAHLHEVRLSARGRKLEGAVIDGHGVHEGGLPVGDGSPKPRRKAKELRANTRLRGMSTDGGEESDPGPWAETEASLDSDPDLDDTSSEDGARRRIELGAELGERNYFMTSVMGASPSERKGDQDAAKYRMPASGFLDQKTIPD